MTHQDYEVFLETLLVAFFAVFATLGALVIFALGADLMVVLAVLGVLLMFIYLLVSSSVRSP
jgi:hypothetical protein